MQQKSNNFTISNGSIVVPYDGFVTVSDGVMYSDRCMDCYCGVFSNKIIPWCQIYIFGTL